MKLKLLGLALLLTLSSFGQDCVPSSLKYLADEMGEVYPVEDWSKVCSTNGVGTDLNNLMSGWSKMMKLDVKLTPIYVLPKLDIKGLDETLEPFRKLEVNREAVQQYFKYLWVGLHDDPVTKKSYVHCAVVVFFEDHVVMISPNSLDANDKMLVEKFDLPTFFSRTFIVFDLEPVMAPRLTSPEKPHRPAVLL